MLDVSDTIAASSDQLNAADLAAPVVVTIERVTKCSGEQPISIHLQGYRGRPWRPCKTMRRLLIRLWGRDGDEWIGRRLRLYCDDSVTWGGEPVGGIRVDALSHLDTPVDIRLVAGRGRYRVHHVEPLSESAAPSSPVADLDQLLAEEQLTRADVDRWRMLSDRGPLDDLSPEQQGQLAGWLRAHPGRIEQIRVVCA